MPIVQSIVAQAMELTQAGTEVVRTASQYGPETFVAVIVLLFVATVTAIWVWQVAVPNARAKMEIEREAAKSSRENAAQLSHAVSTCLPVITSTHERVVSTGKAVDTTDVNVQKLSAAVRVGMIMIEKIAKDVKVDISHEISRIHGILDE